MSETYRSSLVISQPNPGEAVQQGDEGFAKEVLRHYTEAETLALEQLYQLKNELSRTSDDDFWHAFCKGLARIADAQYAIVSKRLDESPPVGDHGSCLMAMCWFYDNGHGVKGSANKINYHAFSCPCSLMSHRKVLLIPERLNETFPDNPNNASLAFPAEAYLALPLFQGDKCIAHFGTLWTLEALQRRKLGWGFLELLYHSLEDIVLQRFLSGATFPKADTATQDAGAIPFDTIAALHSLKPFARNLSHELRTPMQGIVGMLDIMYATIHDALTTQTTVEAALVFEELKDSLQVIQASAKRAVEASDNVVQAYALNMGLPDLTLPTPPIDAPDVQDPIDSVLTEDAPAHRGIKRQRDQSEDHHEGFAKLKRNEVDTPTEREKNHGRASAMSETKALVRQDNYSPSLLFGVSPGVQFVNIRDVINFVVQESLKANGNYSIGIPTIEGQIQRIEVKGMASNGSEQSKTIEWTVHGSVPEFILVDERMLAKMLSCVFQNAVKFTAFGVVKLNVRFCQKRQHVIITVKDTGPGIPHHFKTKIFKPFAREDDSTTRTNEGLGLGLLVAKGLARKLGGDLLLISSDTSGDNKGCEFEMRIPTSPDQPWKHRRPPSPARHLDEPLPRSRQTSIIPQVGLSPSSPSSFESKTGFATSSNNRNVSTETEPVVNHHLPHSPPLSPGCATCNSSEKNFGMPNATPTFLTPRIFERPIETSDTLAAPPAPTVALPNPLPVRQTLLRRRTSQLFDRHLAAAHPLTFLVADDNPVNRKLLVSMLTKLGYDPKTQIYEAYDGAEAVRKVQAATSEPAEGESRMKGPIDVVLMDLWMPAMDGYEATQRILGMFRPRKPSTLRTMSAPDGLSIGSMRVTEVGRELGGHIDGGGKIAAGDAASMHEDSSNNSEVEDEQMRAWRTTLKARELMPPTILAVTADATDGAVEKAKNAGMEGFMVKPFRVKDLEKLIKEGWARRERGVAARRVDLIS